MSLANITVLGNLGRDPETRYTKAGSMNVSFSVAHSKKRTDASGQEHELTNWYRVTAWGKLAEFMDRLAQEGALAKGSQVLVIGELEVRDYVGKDGDARYSLDVNAREIKLAGSRNTSGAYAGSSSASTDIDDLPF